MNMGASPTRRRRTITSDCKNVLLLNCRWGDGGSVVKGALGGVQRKDRPPNSNPIVSACPPFFKDWHTYLQMSIYHHTHQYQLVIDLLSLAAVCLQIILSGGHWSHRPLGWFPYGERCTAASPPPPGIFPLIGRGVVSGGRCWPLRYRINRRYRFAFTARLTGWAACFSCK